MGDDDDSGDSTDADTDSGEEDKCVEQVDSADGDAECTYNEQTGECYGIVRSQGIRGNGNFDDGYNAAKNAAKEESDQLNTIVGVLGGIIGALILVIAGGAYYIYTKDQKEGIERTVSVEMLERDNETTGIAIINQT